MANQRTVDNKYSVELAFYSPIGSLFTERVHKRPIKQPSVYNFLFRTDIGIEFTEYSERRGVKTENNWFVSRIVCIVWQNV